MRKFCNIVSRKIKNNPFVLVKRGKQLSKRSSDRPNKNILVAFLCDIVALQLWKLKWLAGSTWTLLKEEDFSCYRVVCSSTETLIKMLSRQEHAEECWRTKLDRQKKKRKNKKDTDWKKILFSCNHQQFFSGSILAESRKLWDENVQH